MIIRFMKYFKMKMFGAEAFNEKEVYEAGYAG